MSLRRHDLLSATPATWDVMLQLHPELAELPLVADWARRGWPMIVRRRLPGEGSADLPAAVPLPPSYGKQRIAISFPPGAALTALPPVLLRDAAVAAPADWQRTIAVLIAAGEGLGVAPCVFGALLWQHATGLEYLTARSDLDLLWRVSDETVAESLIQVLTRLDAAGPIRLDGELVLPDGAAVNWREFAQADGAAATVLAKTMDGVDARPRSALFRTLVPA